MYKTSHFHTTTFRRANYVNYGSCAVALHSAVLSQMNDNNTPTISEMKLYCAECDCVVVWLDHASRCRPKSVRGWTGERVAAWYGDVVQRTDVMLALRLQGHPCEKWGGLLEGYTSNLSMARYMRGLGASTDWSDHTLGTAFEARYAGEFRLAYLKETFPDVYVQVLSAWQPPVVEVNVSNMVNVGV